LRLDPKIPFDAFEEGTELSIITSKPSEVKITVPLKKQGITAGLFEKRGDNWAKTKEITEVAVLDIFEIGIPFSDLKAKENDEMHLYISISKNAEEIERCPWRGHLIVSVPTADFEALMWY
jgi:hypothetical protein